MPGPVRWTRSLAAALAILAAHATEAAAQCAMCGSAMGSRGGFARGFILSVLFLLSTLALLVAGFVVLVWARNRSLEAAHLHSGAPSASGRTGVSIWRALSRRPFSSF